MATTAHIKPEGGARERLSFGRLPVEGSCALGRIEGDVAPQLQEGDTGAIADEKCGCTPRVQRLRTQFFRNRPIVCLHRARAVTKAYRENPGESVAVTRGRFLKSFCEEKPIAIQDDELIVGNPGCQIRSAMVGPDFCWQWLTKEETARFASRPQDPYLITEEQKEELSELIPYWHGRSLYEYNLGHLPPDTRRVSTNTGLVDLWIKQGVAMDHTTGSWGTYLYPIGLKGIWERAQEKLATLSFDRPDDQEKMEFLQGVVLACEGIQILAQRHADEARRLASFEPNPQRKRELLEIADICERVPWNPPRTFREGIQAGWLASVGGDMEHGHLFGAPRLERDLWPYYQHDLREGLITKDEAQELIECLFVKEAEIIYLQSEDSATYFAGYQGYQNQCVGGVGPDGRDATNELTYMILQACADVRLPGAGVIARLNRRNSDTYVKALADLARKGTGYPPIYNDDVGIPQMLACGASVEDAYDYVVFGCSESVVPGKMWKYSDGGVINMPACMELALNDGYSRVLDDGEGRWGVPTGDAKKFSTYEEVEQAFFTQLSEFTRHICIANMVAERAAKDLTPFLFISALHEDCIDAAMDYTAGGCVYNVGPAPNFCGLADVADSLAAIKSLVFEKKLISMETLMAALENDFEGHEEVRDMLWSQGPKYGRDDPYVDDIAKNIADWCHVEAGKYMSRRGCRFVSAMFPVSAYVPLGMVVGALPSGRRAGKPIADGISPEPQVDRSPTEVIKSVCSYDHIRHENGLLLNMRLAPSVVEGDAGLSNMAALIRSFCEGGGWHIQFNCVDSDTLKAAQANPDEYRSLMVRVAGYSAYFTDLNRDIQDSIIARTEHVFA